MKKYGIGIIGHGGFGKFLNHWWSRMDAVEVVAVTGGTISDVGQSTDIHYYEDWEQLLDDDAVDIVSIATPPSLHVEMACAAMRKNKHVLLEKPVALSTEGVQQIIKVQQETGMVLTVNHMLRYNPIVKTLKRWSDEETFGPLRHAVVTNYAQDEGLPAEHWFWDKEVSGGIFVEHAVHFIDIVNSLTGQKIKRVNGLAHNRNDRQQDQVALSVLYDQGLIASHYHAFSGPGFFERTTIQLTYDLARIEIEGWIPLKGKCEALIKDSAINNLLQLEQWHTQEKTALADVADISRPTGWGTNGADKTSTIDTGGRTYEVDSLVRGTFALSASKAEVYGACVQDILWDLIQKIEDPRHVLRVTLADAYESLKIALAADLDADATSDVNQMQ